MGKAEKTKDDEFEAFIDNFNKQQNYATKYQKELKHYVQCARNLQNASKALCDAIEEIYEPHWTEQPEIRKIIESIEMLWQDYVQRLNEQALTPVNTYQAQFPENKQKIAKRARKMTDYDNARHNLEQLKNAKKRDERKISQADDDMQETKIIFESLNKELHDGLPKLYNGRVLFYATGLQNLFDIESTFHKELQRCSGQITDITLKLDKDYKSGNICLRNSSMIEIESDSNSGDAISDTSSKSSVEPSPVTTRKPATDNNHKVESPTSTTEEPTKRVSNRNSKPPPPLPSEPPKSPTRHSLIKKKEQEPDETDSKMEDGKPEDKTETDDSNQPGYEPVDLTGGIRRLPATAPEMVKPKGSPNPAPKEESDDIYDTPSSNEPAKSVPPETIYSVQVTHYYCAEDGDELSTIPGEVIHVIPIPDPDEADEGWLLGIKASGGKKGMFPANFTRRI